MAQAKYLPSDRPQASGDDHSSPRHLSAEFLVIHALRITHHRERVGEAVVCREGLKAESGQASPYSLGDLFVSPEACFESLVQGDNRCLMECDDLVDTRRRVIATRILHDRQPAHDVGIVSRHGFH